MKALRKGIELLRIALTHPQILKSALHEDPYWKEQLRKHYGHENPLPVVELSEFVPKNAVLDDYTFLGGSSMITDLLLLKCLAEKQDVRSYFEIGTWRGESLNAVLPFVDRAYSLDILGRLNSQRGVLVNEHEKVTWLDGDSASFDFASIGQTCDLIFIDGNHSYAYVRKDTEAALHHLAHENTLIVWHDYGHDPEQVRWEVYKGILDAVPGHLHRYLFHVRNTKCAVLMKTEALKFQEPIFPGKVDHIWEVTIRRKDISQ